MSNRRPRILPRCAALALTVLLTWSASSLLQAEEGVIDLAALPNYARQVIPLGTIGYGQDNTPMGPEPTVLFNPLTDTGATLGRLLFYDKRLSRNNTVSCSSCHQQAHAFSTSDIVGTGVAGTTNRHPMRLINVRFKRSSGFFWDNRTPTLESLVTQPIRNSVEMGFSGTNGDPDFAALIAKLSALPEYQLLFNAAFGSPGIDETRIQKALSQFVRSIQSFDSKFDAGAAIGPSTFPNFTASENRGKQLFFNSVGAPGGGVGCMSCHLAPTFSFVSGGFRNNGVIGAIGGGTDLTVTNSPTLRDMVNPSGQLNGPLMHNGSFTSIAQVIDHYSAIPNNNPNLAELLRNQVLNLTPEDRVALEDFFRTLTGQAVYTDSKWSSPFRQDGTITVVNTAPPPSQTVNLSTRMQVLSADKVGIGGFIITGTAPKRVLVRALGPSLAQFGISTFLADPTITLHGPAGFASRTNDNWRSTQETEIKAAGLAPGNDLEPALVATLAPGSYTAVLSGTNNGIGTAILEIYDLDLAADSKLANISTRAYVGTGDNILIAGFTVGNSSGVDDIIVRGVGPTLNASGIGPAVSDPILEVRNANGVQLAANNDWWESTQHGDISAAGLEPTFSTEAAVAITLGPGAYTALISGNTTTPYEPRVGVALVEVYSRGRAP